MSLEDEIASARKRIYRDGYDMSLGEIASLYERAELVVNPEYQRLFRWDETRRTRFIESILLNVPIPPIFVFSGAGGRWELIDGLQRVSTILEFMGLLKSPEGFLRDRFACLGTELLPSLAGKVWPRDGEEDSPDHVSGTQQIVIKRQRLRIEILGPETDAEIKFELFQRLNTGGANLSEQEIRNCIVISINQEAYNALHKMASYREFLDIISLSEERQRRQYAVELVVRFVVMRHVPYTTGMDLHEYLDKGIIDICRRKEFSWENEYKSFITTVDRLKGSVGDGVFRKNNRFSLAVFEFVMSRASKLLEKQPDVSSDFLQTKVSDALRIPEMERYSGSGVRGTQRLSGLIPKAAIHFAS